VAFVNLFDVDTCSTSSRSILGSFLYSSTQIVEKYTNYKEITV
jgi:hypothetical protein